MFMGEKMRFSVSRFACFVVAAGLFLASGVRTRADEPLYNRLGGEPAIRAVAGGLVDRILLDARVNAWFAHAAASPANAAAYKAKLSDFICQATGGPCQYTGMDMVAAHKGRHVSSEAFDAVVQDLVAVLHDLKVPEKENGEVLALLGPLKTSIVQP
jgi:hemoglobin